MIIFSTLALLQFTDAKPYFRHRSLSDDVWAQASQPSKAPVLWPSASSDESIWGPAAKSFDTSLWSWGDASKYQKPPSSSSGSSVWCCERKSLNSCGAKQDTCATCVKPYSWNARLACSGDCAWNEAGNNGKGSCNKIDFCPTASTAPVQLACDYNLYRLSLVYPIGSKVQVQCPIGCTNHNVERWRKYGLAYVLRGGGDGSAYTSDSQICMALQHSLGVNGGLAWIDITDVPVALCSNDASHVFCASTANGVESSGSSSTMSSKAYKISKCE